MPVLVFQKEVYYKVDRLLTGLTAQWYSNKTSLWVALEMIKKFCVGGGGLFDFNVGLNLTI